MFGPSASDATHRYASQFYHSGDMTSILDLWSRSDEGRAELDAWVLSRAPNVVRSVVSDEMDVVSKKLQLKLADATHEQLLSFRIDTHISPVLDEHAPVMLSILKRGLQSDRAARENTFKSPDTIAAVIGAMVAKHRSQNAQLFSCPAGLALWAAGAPRQIFDILSKLGFTMEYSSLPPARAAIAKGCLELASQQARKRHILTYDNIQISTSIFVEQRDDAPPKVATGTTIILYAPRNPSDAACLLDLILANIARAKEITLEDDILPSPELQEVIQGHQTLHIVERFLRYGKLPSSSSEKFLADPILKHRAVRPPPSGYKTAQFPMQTITIPENSHSSNLKVVTDVYCRQCGMDIRDDALCKYAILSINDQATNSNLRGARQLRDGDSTPFTRLDCIQLAPGLFHTLLNLSWILLDIHRGDAADYGSLASFIILLNKKRHGSEHPDYHAIKATLTQVLDGILLHAWEIECGFPSLKEFAATNPSPQVLVDIGERILAKYVFNSSDPAESDEETDDDDEVFRNVRLLLRDLLLFQTLHEATKSGDFERIEELIGTLIVFFCGAGARNYSSEFMHFQQNLKKGWPAPFADYVRDNMLINMSGHDNHWTGVDENIEHTIKLLQQFYANRGVRASWDELANISPASHIWSRLMKTFRTAIGASYRGSTHIEPDTSALVLRVAAAAKDWSLLVPDRKRKAKKRTVDVFRVGLDRMGQTSKNPLTEFHRKRRAWEAGAEMEPEQDDIPSAE
ncbi:hypothetical protein FA95DRAFT_1525335, partial [Auriscalpium vulgare]